MASALPKHLPHGLAERSQFVAKKKGHGELVLDRKKLDGQSQAHSGYLRCRPGQSTTILARSRNSGLALYPLENETPAKFWVVYQKNLQKTILLAGVRGCSGYDP